MAGTTERGVDVDTGRNLAQNVNNFTEHDRLMLKRRRRHTVTCTIAPSLRSGRSADRLQRTSKTRGVAVRESERRRSEQSVRDEPTPSQQRHVRRTLVAVQHGGTVDMQAVDRMSAANPGYPRAERCNTER